MAGLRTLRRTPRRMPRRTALAAVAAAVLLPMGAAPSAVAAGAPSVPASLRSVTAPVLLPAPANATASYPTGLNGGRVVSGNVTLTGTPSPARIRWTADHLGYTLLTPPGTDQFSETNGINEVGAVIGYSASSPTLCHPVRWAPDGTPTALPAGYRGGNASAINRDGVVASSAYEFSLLSLSGDESGAATSVNDAGTRIGWSDQSAAGGGPDRPVRRSPTGVVTALPLSAGVAAGLAVRITASWQPQPKRLMAQVAGLPGPGSSAER